MRSSKSVFWQKWRSKALTRAYHGDWIQERKFKRHYLPASLPALIVRSAQKRSKYSHRDQKIPLAALMFQELERRLDVAIFRSCFADSVYEARRMIIHGAVKLNGVKCVAAWTRLHPGDMFNVNPIAIPMLNPGKTWPEGLGESYVVDLDRNKETKPHPKDVSRPSDTSSTDSDHSTPSTSSQPDHTSSEPSTASENSSSEISADSKYSSSITSSNSTTPTASTSTERTVEEKKTSHDQQEKTLERDDDRSSPSSQNIDGSNQASTASKNPNGHLTFTLPTYASPFMFIPAYLEVSFRLCTSIYLRHPSSGPGYCEIPTPWDADGEVMKLAWEWYTKHGLGKRIRRERREWDSIRDMKRNPFAEAHFRKRSIGGRVAVHGRYQGGRVGTARLGSGEPRLSLPP